MKFRKKPVVIEAERYWDSLAIPPKGVLNFCVKEPLAAGQCSAQGMAHIHTLEGPLHVSDGDWIITGVKGERYPCKPDIFDATYGAVGSLGLPT